MVACWRHVRVRQVVHKLLRLFAGFQIKVNHDVAHDSARNQARIQIWFSKSCKIPRAHFCMSYRQPFSVKRVLLCIDSVCGQEALNVFCVVCGKLALYHFKWMSWHRASFQWFSKQFGEIFNKQNN